MNSTDATQLYRNYCRPKLADLLKTLRLDAQYVKAKGAYLFDDADKPVLDLIGGFGAALLGHNPPALVEQLIGDLQSGVPFNAQCSVRGAAGELAQRLSGLTRGATGYIVNFSNSGTEANEAAIKHAYKNHFDKVRREYEQITRALSDFYYAADSLGTALKLPGNQKTLIDFRDDLDEYNLGQFELFQNSPVMFALKGSYHGKTMSSLKVTFNKSYREGFEGLSGIDTFYLDLDKPQRLLDEEQSKYQLRFLLPVLQGNQVEVHEIKISRAFALILEVILGEGGMKPVPDNVLAELARISRKIGLPMILDEVQTGCGRTGSIFAYQQTPLVSIEPEYICLSKALGGGLVKIGATMIRRDLYDDDFGILHTSTFGEDELSARVGLRMLDLLTANDNAQLQVIRDKGESFKQQLAQLKEEFPDIVQDVRGRGLMLGIALKPLLDKSPFFRATGKQGILSLIIASYLLHYHRIRVLAPLSSILKGNPGKERLSVLRIQPPATITQEEMSFVIDTLREVFRIIRANNEYCLVAHLLNVDVSVKLRRSPSEHAPQWPIQSIAGHIDARTGFIVHPTKIDYLLDYYFPSAKGREFPQAELQSWWNRICRFLEPVHAHSSTVESHGFIIENSLVFVPYLPDYFASIDSPKLTQEVQDKIQDAVTIAREIGDDNIPVCMVGLGAYTSIATQNGQTVNDYEVPVTTGNAYTVALTLLGLMEGAGKQGIDMPNATAAVVGASGNIGMVTAQLLALNVNKLILIGRHREQSLSRLDHIKASCIEAVLHILVQEHCDGIAPARSSLSGFAARIAAVIRDEWDALSMRKDALGAALNNGSSSPEAARLLKTWLVARPDAASTVGAIVLASEFDILREADLIVVATNSPDPELLHPRMLKAGAVVCCTSVPSNLSPSFATQQQMLAFDGGLARLPAGNAVDFVGMPGVDMIYGCLAETLTLGFEGSDRSFCKGMITLDQVRYIMQAADSHGFALGDLKFGGKVLVLNKKQEELAA